MILQDLERQLANTLRPFGAPLPEHTAVSNYQEQIARIRDRGWSVSGRQFGPVKGSVVIALSLRIDGPDGEMKNFITTMLSERRLAAILAEQKTPADWTKAVYDRSLQLIVAERGGQAMPEATAPTALRSRLAGAGPNDTIEGFVEDVDGSGIPILVAYRRSGTTNWTTTAVVPMAVVDAPVRGVLWQLAGPALLLLVAGGLAAWFTTRQVERPLRALSYLVTEAKGEVSKLSEQLLALQEEERQRIARELHDSTAQHLVAANLVLMRLTGQTRQVPSASKACDEMGDLLDRALLELRVFTYLLHPPNLASDGLRAALRDFVEGFAGRTGVQASVRMSEAVDDASPEIQRAILRVVQEALANVHRHAGASKVRVGARVVAGAMIVRVRDDGRGMPAPSRSVGRLRLGVGIPGMHARLKQFGGTLKIRTGPNGTSLLASVPLSERSKGLAGSLPPRMAQRLRNLRAPRVDA